MESRHVGMGLVLLTDVIDINQEFLFEYLSWAKQEQEDTFQLFENKNEKIAVNKTGFKFNISDVNIAPKRLYDLDGRKSGRDTPVEYLKFVEKLEEAVYSILIEYCKYFPDCATTSWWRSSGHIAEYGPNQRIGLHCDDQIPFEWGEVVNHQPSLHNNCSINLYLNNCNKGDVEAEQYSYTGGEFVYPNAGFEWAPVAGSAVIYPSSYIGRHEVRPVLSGHRYAFLTTASYGSQSPGQQKIGEYNPNIIWMPELKEDLKNSDKTKEYYL